MKTVRCLDHNAHKGKEEVSTSMLIIRKGRHFFGNGGVNGSIILKFMEILGC